MMNIKKVLSVGIITLAIGVSSTGLAFASEGNIDLSIDEIKAQRVEAMQQRLDERVNQGLITKEEADVRIKEMKDRMSNCDGSGIQRGYGNGSGVCDGSGINRTDRGTRRGNRDGSNQGLGNGVCDGSGVQRGHGKGSGDRLGRK